MTAGEIVVDAQWALCGEATGTSGDRLLGGLESAADTGVGRAPPVLPQS